MTIEQKIQAATNRVRNADHMVEQAATEANRLMYSLEGRRYAASVFSSLPPKHADDKGRLLQHLLWRADPDRFDL